MALGKFGKISTAIMALFTLLALAWTFLISKTQLETPALALTLLATAVIPLLGVFMMVKKQKGFTLATLYGIIYLLFGLATVFRVLNAADSFSQMTLYTGVAGAVLGLILVFASGKAKTEDVEESVETEATTATPS